MRRRNLAVLAGVAGSAVLALAAPPAAAQSGASIHLEIEGGQFPGTYDLSTDAPCYVYGEGDGTWTVGLDDPAQAPSYLRFEVGGDFDALTAAWNEGGGYNAFEFEVAVEERNGDATLSITAYGEDMFASGTEEDTAATLRMEVECHAIDDGRLALTTPEPEAGPVALPTPRLQGPPPEGSTVVRLSLDFGPWAGDYESWTTMDACYVSDGAWAVSLHDAMVIPSSVSLLAAEADGGVASIGLFSASFGSLPEVTSYESSPGATFELGPDGRAAVTDPSAVATLPDGTHVEGSLDAAIECAAVIG